MIIENPIGDTMNGYTDERLEAIYSNHTTERLEEILANFQATIEELSSYMNGGAELLQMRLARNNSHSVALELHRRKRASK